MDTLEKLKQVKTKLDNWEPTCAYRRGVKAYAMELLDKLISSVKGGYKQDVCVDNVKQYLLNGAESWEDYSEGGCSLIYNSDIMERLYPPSVVKKTNHGFSGYYKGQHLLTIQASALDLAARCIRFAFKEVERELKEKETTNAC